MDYTKQYNLLISKAKNRSILKTEYKEKHHIIPKALGGNNDKENLVELFVEEHYTAHLLLAKIHGGSMWFAVQMMGGRIGNKCHKWIREKAAETKIGVPRSKETRQKISDAKKGIPSPLKGTILSESHKQSLRDAKSNGFTDEHRQKLRDAKIDYKPWNSYSLWVTPFGSFNSLTEAAKMLPFSRGSIYNRCKSVKFDDWKHEKLTEQSRKQI